MTLTLKGATKRKATDVEQQAIDMATYGGLTPVDLKQCQGLSRQPLPPFTMGGDIQGKWQRCDRRPSALAIEAKPGAQGLRGAQSLCRSCAKHCQEKHPEALYAPSAPFKAAFLLGGHKAVRDMIYAYRPGTPVRSKRGSSLHARRGKASKP